MDCAFTNSIQGMFVRWGGLLMDGPVLKKLLVLSSEFSSPIISLVVSRKSGLFGTLDYSVAECHSGIIVHINSWSVRIHSLYEFVAY